MLKHRKRWIAAALLACVLLGGFGVWVLLHPASIFVQPWRAQRTASSTDEVLFGPYPVEEDFVELKRRGVTTIISLLEPVVPYEAALLAQERERATRHGMRVLNFPMGSILGQKFGDAYVANSRAAAEAALKADGIAYIHCYLGLHRAGNVQKYLDTFVKTATYVGINSERPEDVAAKNRADALFEARDYRGALAELAKIPNKGIRAARREAWSYYRLLQFSEARVRFERILLQNPGDPDSEAGLAYCDLSENRLNDAGNRFDRLLANDPDDAGLVEGLAHTRLRQDRIAEARTLFERAIVLNPDNPETRQLLAKLQAASTAITERQPATTE